MELRGGAQKVKSAVETKPYATLQTQKTMKPVNSETFKTNIKELRTFVHV